MKRKIILSILLIFVVSIGAAYAYTPKIMIESYSFEKENPVAGEKNTLILNLKNTSDDYAIRNLSIVFNASQNKESKEKREITTYGSSDTFYIEKIYLEENEELKIPIYISPNIASGVHEIPIKFSYQDVNGTEYEQIHTISVPVSVTKKLDISEITVPDKVPEGEEFNVQLRLFNESKSTIENVKLKLVSEGKSYENDIRIGKIEQGETEYVDFKLSSDKVGELKGKVNIVFEDEWKKTHEQTKEFKLNIVEKVVTPEEEKTQANYMPYLIGAVVLVVLYLIYRGIKNRKKNKKNKELELNE